MKVNFVIVIILPNMLELKKSVEYRRQQNEREVFIRCTKS